MVAHIWEHLMELLIPFRLTIPVMKMEEEPFLKKIFVDEGIPKIWRIAGKR